MTPFPEMTPILVSYLQDDPGWNGKVFMDMARYHALGREQEEAAAHGRLKYAAALAKQSAHEVECRRRKAAELLKRRETR